MAAAGTWSQKIPANDEIIEVFCSKSNYFKYYRKTFTQIPNDSPIQKWLQGGSDAPCDYDVWGGWKQTFDNLLEILDDLSTTKKKSGGKKEGKDKGEKKGGKAKSSKKKGQA